MPLPVVNVAAPINRAHPLMQRISARWKVLPFGQWAGGTLFKDLCRAYDGTRTAGTAWGGNAGRQGGYGAIVGTNSSDYVALPIPTTAPTAYTWAFWIKASAAPSTANIKHALFAHSDVVGFSWNHSNATFTQAWAHQNIGATYLDAKYTSTLTGGIWYRMMLTWDGANIRAYLNGIKEKTTAATTIQTFSTTTAILGRPGSNAFDFQMDDVCWWFNRALSDIDALEDFRATSQQFDPTLNWVRGWSRKAATGAAATSRLLNLRRRACA